MIKWNGVHLVEDGENLVSVRFRGFIVNIFGTDEGIVVNVFDQKKFDSGVAIKTMASTYAYDNDLCEGYEEEKK